MTWLNIVPPPIPGLIALGIALVNGRRHDLEIERQNQRHDWQESLNLIRQKVEEYHQQSDVLVHHPEQVIEDEQNGYIAKRAIEELDREA